MGFEFEIKFRATPQQLQALRSAFSEPEQHFAMETTYYDTPEGDLSARAYTLRRRMENELSVCTLKTPAGELGRGEYELRCDCIEDAIPELCKLSGIAELPALAQKGLICVCGAKFDRIAKMLTLPECVVELALDLGVLTGGGRAEPLCEVEVELKSGSQAAALAFARQLAADYGLQPETKSKFRRALALAERA